MRPGLEFLGFASLAAVAHLAVFAATLPDGMEAGGAGGAQEVTVAAPLGGADAALAEMVARWEAPPAISEPEAPATTAAPAATAPALPLPEPEEAPALQAAQLPEMRAPEASAEASRPPPPVFDMPETRETPRPRARPEPRQAAPAAPPAQRAAGQGQARQSGQGQARETSGAAPSASALAQWGGGIRAAIQRQQRSPGARARGTVHLRLQVNADGRLAGVSVTQGSGNAQLDRAAVQAVQRARLPRAPSGVSGTHQFNLPLSYR